MKNYKWINIVDIDIKNNDKLPLNLSSLNLANKLLNNSLSPKNLPPIKVFLNKDGRYILKNGRHRYVAFRLCNIKQIYAEISKPFKFS
jgi:hypothetical protein